MLFGASDFHTQDVKMQITLAFNHFGKRMVQRMPRCRFGYVHVVNNDYTHWNMYAIGGSKNPTIISQGNRYIFGGNNPYAKEVFIYIHRNHSCTHKQRQLRCYLNETTTYLILAGDEEGIHSGIRVEALDMEIGGRSFHERSILRAIR